MSEIGTVYHVDDDPLVRRSVELLVRSVHLDYLGFSSVNDFLAAGPPQGPACLITDLRMPGLNGMELVRHASSRTIQMPILVFTAHADVAVAVAAMKAGVVDFIQKPASDQLLLDAIQSALSLDLRRHSQRALHRQTADRLNTLSSGERQVLDLIVEGKSNKAIATTLGISYKTVEARRARLMEKMGHETLAGLLADVLRWQLSQDPR